MATLTTIDYAREWRELYTAGSEPALVEVPPLRFLMVDGEGDPRAAPAFADAIAALYAIAYPAKFALRRLIGVDHRVPPLEALWWSPDAAPFAAAKRSEWRWTAMVMQPESLTEEIVERARAKAAAKKLVALARVRLDALDEGHAAQVLHIGPYSAEGPTIERLHAFIEAQGLRPRGAHHEIYLGDPRRCAPARLRTIVRQPVADAA